MIIEHTKTHTIVHFSPTEAAEVGLPMRCADVSYLNRGFFLDGYSGWLSKFDHHVDKLVARADQAVGWI